MQTREYGVLFIEYVLPNGKTKDRVFETTQEVYEKAVDIRKAGFRFEMEILRNGMVSATISDDDGDYHHMLFANKPTIIQESIDALIMNAKIADMRSVRSERTSD